MQPDGSTADIPGRTIKSATSEGKIDLLFFVF